MKILLREYNSSSSQPYDELTISDALEPSVIAARLEKLGSTTPAGVSSGKKQEAMDAYLLIMRSSEEIALLEKEMENIVDYYENRDTTIVQNLIPPCLNQFDRGRKALLCGLLKQNNKLLMRSCQVHAQMLRPLEGSVSPTTDESDDVNDFHFE